MQLDLRPALAAGFCLCLLACEDAEKTKDGESREAGAGDAAISDQSPSTSDTEREAGASTGVDAGRTDAGRSDTGRNDAAVDAAVASDAQTPRTDASHVVDSGGAGGDAGSSCSALFCDDFESGELDTKRWTRVDTDVPANSVKVQGAVVAHGRFAAQLHAKGGSSRAMMFNQALPQALRKHYFGRMYARITNFPSEGGGHSAFVTSSASLTGYPYMDHHLEVGLYNDEGAPIWQLTYWTGDGPEYIASGGHIPKDTWFCMEWEFNDAPNQIAVWVDGDAAKNGAAFRNIDNNKSNLLGELATVGLGYRTWHPMGSPDIDVFIDDVALDTKRVPCLP